MSPFTIQKGNIFAVPIIHYNMEMAACVKSAIDQIKPDCIAVELPETMQLQLLHAASRLPDISVVIAYTATLDPIYILSEPCDGSFEALRSALEQKIPSFCIDLDIDCYPETKEYAPDPYAIHKIGLKKYFEAYEPFKGTKSTFDTARELYMAKRLKELSLSYDRILFVGGMFHVTDVLSHLDKNRFPEERAPKRDVVQICTVTEESCREILSEYGWISASYEESRKSDEAADRQKLLLSLYKEAAKKYTENSGTPFPSYHLRTLMKYARNYALIKGQLMPDLFQLLSAAKGCVEHNFAYEVWELATHYPHLKNVDGLEELDLDTKDIWGDSKSIQFHLRDNRKKSFADHLKRRKDRRNFRFSPPSFYSICSYPPEDIVIERFGDFLKKKGTQIITEEAARVVPFSTSLEDGLDMRETLRHWLEHKLYVRVRGKPTGGVGSIVIVFDPDTPSPDAPQTEKYPWASTWLGEHEQESDMAFFATPIREQVIGPGISRCEYGGLMMSYPPRRMADVWTDPDYSECRDKGEVLLMAAIDYATKPLITYVAAKPPRQALKSYAKRFGKKVVYLPIGQLSPVTIRKIRTFHVLDGQDKRGVAGEYIE